ncbi:MAG: hypothetical protein WCC26_05440 [Terracidiphilus sp.]
MNTHDEERIRHLLKAALPPIENTEPGNSGPARDLWPAILRRLDERPAPPWFDWALAGGLALFAVAFPATIPVFLYYL